VNSRAVRVKQFLSGGKAIQASELKEPKLFENADDPELAQYLVGIQWRKTFSREDAKFRRNAGLYTPQRVVASLANQPKTRRFVEEMLGVSLDELASGAAVTKQA
jgi:hypothetical protein